MQLRPRSKTDDRLQAALFLQAHLAFFYWNGSTLGYPHAGGDGPVKCQRPYEDQTVHAIDRNNCLSSYPPARGLRALDVREQHFGASAFAAPIALAVVGTSGITMNHGLEDRARAPFRCSYKHVLLRVRCMSVCAHRAQSIAPQYFRHCPRTRGGLLPSAVASLSPSTGTLWRSVRGARCHKIRMW
jgi:hypothetical protein